MRNRWRAEERRYNRQVLGTALALALFFLVLLGEACWMASVWQGRDQAVAAAGREPAAILLAEGGR